MFRRRSSRAAAANNDRSSAFSASSSFSSSFQQAQLSINFDDTLDAPTLDPSSLPVSAKGTCLKGEPVQVVVAEPDDTGQHHFKLDDEALQKILLNEQIRDKKVAIVSVAGAFRKGKSFLLDFFLRYLDCPDKEAWIGDADAPLEGFSWRGGSERDTTGILLWSEPYLVRRRRKKPGASVGEEEEIAVLLMDTQGAFDSLSTVRDCATVFALSTMLSSVQVYNLTSNIQEDDLQHLQLFTEYGRLALEENSASSRPFQNLEFLVRDWCYPYEAGYGEDGGQKILDRRFQISDRQHEELQQLRKHIRSCFERIGCFLMPHPGMKVATNPHFDGRVRDIEPDFITQLCILVPLLLRPDNLVVKVINGHEVTARELLEYFKAYIKIYQGDTLPEPKSMLRATAEANNLAAVASSKDVYIRAMDEVAGCDCPYLAEDLLIQEQERCRKLCLDKFHSVPKMGGLEMSQMYAEQLSVEMDQLFEQYKVNNQSKNLFVGVKTPLVFFVIMVFNYFVSGFLAMLGLDPVASIFNWVLFAALIALLTWVYVRYSGHNREIGRSIDHVAEVLMEKVLQPLYVYVTQRAVQQMFNQSSSVPFGASAMSATVSAASSQMSAGPRRHSSLRPVSVHSKPE